MIINEDFPRPKFQIGQEMLILSNHKKQTSKEVYVIVEITLSCISVIQEKKEENFVYSIIPKDALGHRVMPTAVRESFLTPLNGGKK